MFEKIREGERYMSVCSVWKRLAKSGVSSIRDTTKFPKQVMGLKKQANKTKPTN